MKILCALCGRDCTDTGNKYCNSCYDKLFPNNIKQNPATNYDKTPYFTSFKEEK